MFCVYFICHAVLVKFMVPNHINYYGTAIIERVKMIIFRGNDVELPLVLNSLTMVDLNTVCVHIPETLEKRIRIEKK